MTWTAWENFSFIQEADGDGNAAWTDEGDLSGGVGDAWHASITTLNDYSNRLFFNVREAMWAADSLTENHRLRSLEFRFECRQGHILNQTDPNDLQVYWAGGAATFTPPIAFVWPGTVFTATHSLASWGFDTSNDGVNAMREIIDETVAIRIRAKKARSSTANVSWLQEVECRIEYDLPVPDRAGLLVGIY
jgi:hypothetical protein